MEGLCQVVCHEFSHGFFHRMLEKRHALHTNNSLYHSFGRVDWASARDTCSGSQNLPQTRAIAPCGWFCCNLQGNPHQSSHRGVSHIFRNIFQQHSGFLSFEHHGSGKTTLLRCVAFLERAESGKISIGGKSIEFSKAKKRDILEFRKKIAFVFQEFNLFNNKTALQNVTEGLIAGRKVPKAAAVEIAHNALEKVGLTERDHYYPSQLSGGQRQRVAIARAIVLNPEVILFDEPTSALDPELIGETLSLIKKIAKEGISMIIVTHEISFAYEVANHVIYIDDGTVVEEGDPGEVLANPKEDKTKQFLKRILKPIEYNI
jgi:L-cystine transport system ATP-binding protein